jgi:hypothetical protein
MKTTINLSDELRGRLDAHLIRAGSSLNKIISLALDHYLYTLEREAALNRMASQPLPGDPVKAAALQVVKELNSDALPGDDRI